MIYLWEIDAEVLVSIAEMPASASCVVQLEYSGDGNELFVLGDDGRILCLDFTPGGCEVKYEVSCGECFINFSVDVAGKYLSATTSTGLIRLYDLGVAMSTAMQVKDARRRMGMPSEQVNQCLHTRTPTGSVGLVKPTSNSMWAAHGGGKGEVDVGDVRSELIDEVFGAAGNSSNGKKKKGGKKVQVRTRKREQGAVGRERFAKPAAPDTAPLNPLRSSNLPFARSLSADGLDWEEDCGL